MLNEAMDEVVLVKGWKKSANWSFPRGKINKDEDDLDCAVREVYEETGFDIRAAGLVRDAKEMKYIEVTMREQHMRLYVFRGVPKDAYFEPKTRKEISKIEWYKLMDLPTLKKNRQVDGSGTDQPALNANKFYMVAPFLNPLKKWIAQQRKKEGRYSSHLSAPPMVPEEVTTEDDRDTNGAGAILADTVLKFSSDLPEVTYLDKVDPTLQLKQMLNVGSAQHSQPETLLRPNHMQEVDTQKSNALLALLRSGPQGQLRNIPQTPLEQMSASPQPQPSPLLSHARPPQMDQAQPPPPFMAQAQHAAQSSLPHFSRQATESPSTSPAANHPWQQPHHVAPYQRTGDPQFAQHESSKMQHPAVPPASALPKLTNHTKALLDVFKGATSPVPSGGFPANTGISGIFSGAGLLSQFGNKGRDVSQATALGNEPNQVQLNAPTSSALNQALDAITTEKDLNHALPMTSPKRPANARQASLLGLFNQAPKTKAGNVAPVQMPPPVELAATTAVSPSPKRSQPNNEELLYAMLRQGGQQLSRKGTEAARPSPREGETSATINGPLNQPEFDAVTRATRHTTNEMRRSPLTSNRTLYDPNQPAPVKILTRPDGSRQPAPQSPREIKAPPKRAAREKSTPKGQTKAFQPQILRRPQTGEPMEPSAGPARSGAMNQQAVLANAIPSPPAVSLGAKERLVPIRQTSHTEAHKQSLLSLFGGMLDTTPRTSTMQTGSEVVSPLTASQLVATNGEISMSGIEPISTRTSRVGSLASIASGPAASRVPSEKRHTGAENKAFLLGYLGRIASQEH